jgi:peptidoglycan lytic transglycosylase G
VSDGRDTSWNDGRGRQRRHHPAVDHGHDVLRDQPDGWPGGPTDYPQQRPGPPGQQYNERTGRRDNGYPPRAYDANGYPPPAYDANGYPVPAYDANGYPVQTYDANGYPVQAYDANGYPIRVYDGNGYDANGYDANGYDIHGYQYGYDVNGRDANGYPANYGGPGRPFDPESDQTEAGPAVNPAYDPRGYGQPGPGYAEPGYSGPGYGDPGYGAPGYGDPRYTASDYPDQHQPGQTYPPQGYPDPGYPDAGYPGHGYPGQGYDPRYGDLNYPGGNQQPGYPAPGQPDERLADQGYGRPGHDGQGYGGDQGYGAPGGQRGVEPMQQFGAGSGGYPTGGFIERGFGGDDYAGADPASTTGGRGMGAVGRPQNFPDAGDPRTTGGNRRVASGPGDDDFPPIPVGTQTKRRRGRAPIVLAIIIVLLAIVGGGGYWGIGKVRSYFGAADYSGNGTSEIVKVKVARGDSSTAIAQTLLAQQVVKSTKAFVKAATADPKSVTIEAGWYRLHKHMSAKSALAALEAKDTNGNPANLFVYKVTIPEGTISVDIYTLLSKQTDIPVGDFIAAAKDPASLGVDKSWYTAKRDDHRSTVTATEKGFKYPAMIEGFLFPATYSFQPDETAKDMLSDMVKKFNDVMTTLDFKNRAQTKLGGIPPIEALIAASIAQKEATTPADMAGVAKVLYNRVFKGLANGLLGVDSETNYFLRMTGHDSKTSDKLKASELSNPNDPYNTHTVAGFPPGAISNPGEAALKAAVNPDPTKKDYGYFQTVGTNTKVVFSKTYAEFCALNSSC